VIRHAVVYLLFSVEALLSGKLEEKEMKEIENKKADDNAHDENTHPLLDAIDEFMEDAMKNYSQNMRVKVEVYSTNPHVLFFPSIKEFTGKNGWDKDKPRPGCLGVRFCQEDGVNGWSWNNENELKVFQKNSDGSIINCVKKLDDTEVKNFITNIEKLIK
jgi:hypothetical protein